MPPPQYSYFIPPLWQSFCSQMAKKSAISFSSFSQTDTHRRFAKPRSLGKTKGRKRDICLAFYLGPRFERNWKKNSSDDGGRGKILLLRNLHSERLLLNKFKVNHHFPSARAAPFPIYRKGVRKKKTATANAHSPQKKPNESWIIEQSFKNSTCPHTHPNILFFPSPQCPPSSLNSFLFQAMAKKE